MSTKDLPSTTALMIGVVVVTCFTIAAVALVAIAAPEGDNTGNLITILMGSLPPTVASLLALAKVSGIGAGVEKIENHTTDLTNGLMDSKIRAAVADVLPGHLIDPAARDQITADVERRDNHG